MPTAIFCSTSTPAVAALNIFVFQVPINITQDSTFTQDESIRDIEHHDERQGHVITSPTLHPEEKPQKTPSTSWNQIFDVWRADANKRAPELVELREMPRTK